MVTMIGDIQSGLANLRRQYERDAGALQLLQQQRAGCETALAQVREDLETGRLVQTLFARMSEFARAQIKTRIEALVTAALQAVFPEQGLSFRVVLGTVSSQPAASWEVVSMYGAEEVADSPEDSQGGGISDVVSAALRLAVLELLGLDGPVLIDEGGKHIDAAHAPHFAAFLKGYAQRTGRQCLLVTHQDALAEAADVTYRVLKNQEGRSEVTRVG